MPRRTRKLRDPAAGLAQPDRIALNWLLLTGLAACAGLAFDLPLWTSVAFALCVVWRYLIERVHFYRPGWLLRYVLVALVVLGVLREFGSLFGRDPGLALLVGLLGLKLLELRTVRDAIVTLLLMYVAMLGGFLFGQSLLLALWTLAGVTISLAALTRLQQPLPARAALRLAGGLVLKAIPLLVIMYLLFPRIGGTLWGLPADAYKGLTGIPDEVRPGNIHELFLSSEVALRVDILEGERPPARELYWRALVLTETDGRTWRRSSASDTSTLTPGGPPVRYRVTVEPSNKRWLFALDLPASTPKGAYMRPGFTLRQPTPIRERSSYEVTSFPRYTTGALSPAERELMLQQPAVSARVREFADALRAQHADPAARVQAVLQHIRRENFVYTLTPPLLGDDPVDEFLFETRRGFCEHYASAFVALMRAAGVPARMVVGYQGGELNPTGNYLIVRQSDAHSWAEVELPQRGWVRVDPTAAVAPERVEFGIEAIRRLEAQGLVPGAVSSELLARALDLPVFQRMLGRARLLWDYTNIAWYRLVVDYRRGNQEGLLHALGFQTIEWSRVLIVLGGACALVLMAYVAWSRRGPRRDPLQRLYARFCRKLARAGVTRAPYEGPLAFAERAARARPALAPAVAGITARYLRLRYGRGAGDEELNELRRNVGALRVP